MKSNLLKQALLAIAGVSFMVEKKFLFKYMFPAVMIFVGGKALTSCNRDDRDPPPQNKVVNVEIADFTNANIDATRARIQSYYNDVSVDSIFLRFPCELYGHNFATMGSLLVRLNQVRSINPNLIMGDNGVLRPHDIWYDDLIGFQNARYRVLPMSDPMRSPPR